MLNTIERLCLWVGTILVGITAITAVALLAVTDGTNDDCITSTGAVNVGVGTWIHLYLVGAGLMLGECIQQICPGCRRSPDARVTLWTLIHGFNWSWMFVDIPVMKNGLEDCQGHAILYIMIGILCGHVTSLLLLAPALIRRWCEIRAAVLQEPAR